MLRALRRRRACRAKLVSATIPQRKSNYRRSSSQRGSELKNSKRLKKTSKIPGQLNIKQSQEVQTIFFYRRKIRVGSNFQAEIPNLININGHKCESIDKHPVLLWAPTKRISDLKLNEYILFSKIQYGYNSEQALGMLLWHRYNVKKAIRDLENYESIEDKWTTEEINTFESIFYSFGKQFILIKEKLPHKSISSIVVRYYSLKHMLKKNFSNKQSFSSSEIKS